MGADKTNNIMTLSSGVSQPLLADVQYFELYSSLALNRKLKNIVLPGFYCGFEPVPGTGLSVRITSENSEGKGAASVDVNNVQISVQQIEDVTVSVKAGATNIIVLEANFEHGVKTTQVDSASSVSAARIYARTDNTIGQNQIELCRVIVPSGATAVTKEMIVLKYRVNRAVGVEFSNEISSTEERKAATPLAVKTLHDLVDTKAPINSPNLTGTPTAPTATKGTNNTQIASTAFVMAAIAELVDSSPDALNTLNELAAALGNDPNFSATVTRLIGEKVAKDGDTMTGKLNLPQTSAFGINTNNRLGGNSLTLGDDDTGIKQEGDGALSVFANGQRVFLFTERSITSLKELLIGDARYSTGGDVYGSQWGDGWLSSWLSARFAECANASHNHPWSQITDVPAASLTQSGIVQLSSAINSSSETLAATPKAVKAAYDLANGKYTAQDATTAQKGIVQLSSATNSASETLAATPKAVKAAYDLANGKYTAQDATTARKGLVQLSSATNSTSETLAATPKAVKAVMDETNKKAPLNSPALTGTPTTPTAPQGTNNTQIASTAFVMAAIAALVDSSPDALNTLNELAAALGNDPNFATTMTNALAGKQSKDATLTALAELATSADKLPYFTGADSAALTALTSVGRAILGKTSTQGVLDYLGLGASAFGLKNVVYYTSAQVVQWPVPDILKQGRRCYVVVIGGGASGAYGNEKAGGTGGSSGGRSEKIVDLTGVDEVTVTVGAGGAAIDSNNSAGNPGATSSFGTYLSATGAPATNIFSSQPGGKGIGGDVNIAGFPGTPAVVCSTDGKRTGGNGGGPGAGAGKYDTTQQGAEYERNARFPGSGGAGLAYYSGLTGSTGRGADGAVYIYW